jgi:hypothetical protein
MKSGVEIIADERQRQIEVEKFSPESDMHYKMEQLACAAVCYAAPQDRRNSHGYNVLNKFWPWPQNWWKPAKKLNADERIKELAKAGALIAAEIDRLQSIQK